MNNVPGVALSKPESQHSHLTIIDDSWVGQLQRSSFFVQAKVMTELLVAAEGRLNSPGPADKLLVTIARNRVWMPLPRCRLIQVTTIWQEGHAACISYTESAPFFEFHKPIDPKTDADHE